MALFSRGMIFVVDQLAPLIPRDPNGKIVGIKGGAAHHSQDFTVARVHSHDGAVLVTQSLFGCDLQIEINGELELFAGLGWGLIEAANFSPTAIHNGSARTVLAHQYLVVLQFHARLSDHVAGIVELPARLVEHLLADFADVADQVGHEPIARIKPAVGHDGIQFGQFVAVGFDESQFILSDVVFQKDGLILRHGGEVADAVSDFFGIEMQTLGDEARVGGEITGRVAQQQRGKRRIVLDDGAALRDPESCPAARGWVRCEPDSSPRAKRTYRSAPPAAATIRRPVS